jgi:chemotaxis protein MotB
VRIEGHTDNQPIHNAEFSDNWDLSTARATELVRLLMLKYGFAPERLSAAGYAQYHPVSSNDTPESRAQNRRVDRVIVGKVTATKVVMPAPSNAGPATPAPPDATPLIPKPSPAVPASSAVDLRPTSTGDATWAR